VSEKSPRDRITLSLPPIRASSTSSYAPARGAIPQEASSGTEAIEMLRDVRPDVMISDIGMPRMDGYDLIRRVRALLPEQGGLTPAAALTAYARAEDRRRALDAGFEMHIAKPVEPAELVTAVATLAKIAGAIR
jgi:CheY-like chemotaxis protein